MADIEARRISVPVATRRVRPERINTPCTKRRIPMAAGHGRNSHKAPYVRSATSAGRPITVRITKSNTGGIKATRSIRVEPMFRAFAKFRSLR